MNDYSALLKIVKTLFWVTGYPSILIVGIMPIYLIFKHKSINAWAYWQYATAIEKKIINAGYIGFLFAITMAIATAILSNI